MNHLMIDLETLGTDRDSVVLSIGAVEFDLLKGEQGNSFKVNIDIQSSLEAGLKINGDTLKWWLTQRPEILSRSLYGYVVLEEALKNLTNFIINNDIAYVWGNSASFDLGLLKDCYSKFNMEVPWSYRGERCYRTMFNMVYIDAEKPKDAHDPIVDCRYQIDNLIKIWSKIRNTTYEKA